MTAAITAETLNETFALLKEVARKGERCPAGKPFGPLVPAVMSALAHAGRIRIEIFCHNFRVVTIMEGPNKGLQTMPSPHGGLPYRTVFRDHIAVRGNRVMAHAGSGGRPQPSLARFSFDE